MMNLEGRIKRLRRTLPAPGRARSIPSIISSLATEMKEAGFQGSRAGTVWKEMESFAVLSTGAPIKANQKFQLIKPLAPSRRFEPVSKGDEGYDHFRYRGNNLTALIPDLQAVVEGMKYEKATYGQGT
jgi:hypothetical protein